jgi:hypothetical protein
MIELRIVEHELGVKPEFQYRYHIFTVDASGGLCPPSIYGEWSEWETAEWINAKEIENDYPTGLVGDPQ